MKGYKVSLVLATCPQCGAQVSADATFCTACGENLRPAIAETAQDNVKRCSYCNKTLEGQDAYYFKCRYCEKDFCSEHRLPENHLCKSSPLRRNIPSTNLPYYTSSAGTYSSTGSTTTRTGGFSLNLSKQGRNLAIAIVLGLPIGFVFHLFGLGLLFTQYNFLVYHGWIPPLFTSMIVVYPGYQGALDVTFNAIFVVFVDRLLAATYTSRQYYGVFVATGLAGNLLSLLGGPNILSFGASGGLFGLLSGAVACDYAISHKVNMNLLLWFLIVFIFSSISGGVDVLAHLGGSIVGLPLGFAIGHARRVGFRRQS
jgi:membrane associated rhomboid family serine protease